jgi:murein DD-endopeptidase MepM/ murein hydrolase activator NlpD
MMERVCPRCATTVAISEGKAIIKTDRSVELWHSSCWVVRNTPIAAATERVVPPPPPRAIGKAVVKVVVSSLLAITVAQWAWLEYKLPAASLVTFDLETKESARIDTHGTSHELTPIRPVRVETALQIRYPVPVVAGQPLDELFPSLREWTHPITSSPELMPAQSSRHFGAERIGIERPECGLGHCGVDLDGPRGRPIVSVADGVVVRVEHSELGLDGRSGRYVRIEHDDGSLTAYMHLDEIAEGLEVGDHVEAGQLIGTLGATAVYTAPPHCHFTLELPDHPGRHGDNTETHYVDPAPFLVRATIAPAPDRRRGDKPAM